MSPPREAKYTTLKLYLKFGVLVSFIDYTQKERKTHTNTHTHTYPQGGHSPNYLEPNNLRSFMLYKSLIPHQIVLLQPSISSDEVQYS